MSAGRNNASILLIALISTIVLFLVFVAVAHISALAKESYALDYGWQTAPKHSAAHTTAGECDRALTVKGFPIRTQRPDSSDPTGCSDQTNPLARGLDLALCFALAAMISVGVAEATRSRL